MTRVVMAIASGASAAVVLAAFSDTALAHTPKCPLAANRTAAVGHPRHVYRTPHGCAFLRRGGSATYKPFASLVVRREGRTRVLGFPWPAFSKVVAGVCLGGPELFFVNWPYVAYSIGVCDAGGLPVRLGSLGYTNRATGVFRVATTARGTPSRLVAVAIPPNWFDVPPPTSP